MIEEAGRVVALESGAVWVATLRRSGCGRCDEPGGCGNGALARRAREKVGHVLALTDQPLAVGDEVLVGVPEQAMLRGTLLIYVLPVLSLVGGAVAGAAVFPGDAGTALGLLAGLLAGFAAVRVLSSRAARDPAVQPVVIRRLAAADAAGCARHT
ncbi:MAG: SoxR reducing system RseC family protein [Gammaproteobacteria bacterium]